MPSNYSLVTLQVTWQASGMPHLWHHCRNIYLKKICNQILGVQKKVLVLVCVWGVGEGGAVFENVYLYATNFKILFSGLYTSS